MTGGNSEEIRNRQTQLPRLLQEHDLVIQHLHHLPGVDTHHLDSALLHDQLLLDDGVDDGGVGVGDWDPPVNLLIPQQQLDSILKQNKVSEKYEFYKASCNSSVFFSNKFVSCVLRT